MAKLRAHLDKTWDGKASASLQRELLKSMHFIMPTRNTIARSNRLAGINKSHNNILIEQQDGVSSSRSKSGLSQYI